MGLAQAPVKGLFVADRPSSTSINPILGWRIAAYRASTSHGVTSATFTIGQSQDFLPTQLVLRVHHSNPLRRLHRRFAWRGGATGALQSPSHVHDRDRGTLITQRSKSDAKQDPEASKLNGGSAHTPGGFGGVPQSVGKDFNAADKGKGTIKPAKRTKKK